MRETNPFSDPLFGLEKEASNPFLNPDFGKPPRTRGVLETANDTVIEVANAAAGGVSSLANFVRPGNQVSSFIDKNIIKAGEAKQSDVVQSAKQALSQGIQDADGIGGELAAVGKYAVNNPLLTVAQAAGSFAVPGAAVKVLGRAGGIGAGAAMAGGDAAGTAYDLSSKAGATDAQALAAGRQASVIPALVGGVTGAFGAEKLLAGGSGFKGGIVNRAVKTGLSEAGQEGFEEGVTQYEGQRAAMPYDATIDPAKGVAAAAGMGAIMGGATGAGVSLLTGNRDVAKAPPEAAPVEPVLPAPTPEFQPVQPTPVIQPTPTPPLPSEQMGIDRTAGVLSSAAALAVDTGVHEQTLQAAAQKALNQEIKPETAKNTTKTPEIPSETPLNLIAEQAIDAKARAEKAPENTPIFGSAYAQRQASAPKVEPTDILAANRQPFATEFTAKRAAEAAGEGFRPFKIAKKQFVVRNFNTENIATEAINTPAAPKIEPQNAPTTQAQAVEAGASAGIAGAQPSATSTTARATGALETAGVVNSPRPQINSIQLRRDTLTREIETGLTDVFGAPLGKFAIQQRKYQLKQLDLQQKETNAESTETVQNQAQQQTPVASKSINALPYENRFSPDSAIRISPTSTINPSVSTGLVLSERSGSDLPARPTAVSQDAEKADLGSQAQFDTALSGILRGQRSRQNGIIQAKKFILANTETTKAFIPAESRATMASLDAYLEKEARKARVGVADEIQAEKAKSKDAWYDLKQAALEKKALEQAAAYNKELDTQNIAAESINTPASSKMAPKKVSQTIVDMMSRHVFRETVSNSIQNDGQKVLDAHAAKDIPALQALAKKYAKDQGRLEGGGGAGPGKVKQAKRGASDVFQGAQIAMDDIKQNQPVPPGLAKMREGKAKREAEIAAKQRADHAKAEQNRKDRTRRLTKMTHDKSPFLGFLGKHGINIAEKREFSPDKNPMLSGYGPMFRKNGLPVDQLIQRAVEEGYLPPGTNDDVKLRDLITQQMGGKNIAPMYTENGAADAMQAEIDRRAQFEEDDAFEALSSDAYTTQELDIGDDIPWDAPASASTKETTRQAMEAMGFSEQEIQDEITRKQGSTQANRKTGDSAGKTEASQPSESARAPAGQSEGLTAPTREDVLAQQDRAAQVDQDQAAADKATDKAAKQAADKKDINARQDASADNFQLGQSAKDSLSGQSSMFDAPKPAYQGVESIKETSDKVFAGMDSAQHESEAKRIRKAAKAMSDLPAIAAKYNLLAKNHEIAAKKKQEQKQPLANESIAEAATKTVAKIEGSSASADRGVAMYSRPTQSDFASQVDAALRGDIETLPQGVFQADLGEIDVVRGVAGDPSNKFKGGYGLLHIQAKHPEIDLHKLDGIIARMKVTHRYDNRVILQDGDKTAVVKTDMKGNDRRWLLTAYEVSNAGANPTIGSTSFTAATGTSNRADEQSLSNNAPPVNSRIEATSGLPVTQVKSKDQSDAILLNRTMANHFKDNSWSNAYEQVDLPDTLSQYAAAASAAFDAPIVAIRPTDARFDQFNGINVARRNYVNIDADTSFINIAGHEIYHDIERNRPDLHAWFVAQADQHFKDFDAYKGKLNSVVGENETAYTAKAAQIELLADFTGDALADPVFVAKLAENNPSKFRELLKHVANWLRDVASKLSKKDLGSSKYFNDVEAMRKHLNKVLLAYTMKKDIAEFDAPKFSRETNEPTAPNGVGKSALEELSQADDLFALPKSEKKDIQGIISDNSKAVTTSTTRTALGVTHKLTMPDGTTATLTERKSNSYGKSLYGYDLVSGEMVNKVTERPGENPDDVQPTTDLWLDVSKLKTGQNGALAYNIAATYAHNNGMLFIGDPAGLSDAALRRRTEQMISSALKFGTTDHLAPHPRQVKGDAGVPPLKWVYGDSAGNIERMIDVSMKSLENAFPTSKLIAYKDGNFYRTDTGQVFSDRGQLEDVFEKSIAKRFSLDERAKRTGYSGWRSVARNALFRSFAESNQNPNAVQLGANDSKVLDGLREALPGLRAGQAESGAGEAKDRIFYSRATAASLTKSASDKLGEVFSAPGKVSWWHKSFGTMYNLSERSPAFKPVFEAAQNFINDTSYYATEAADLAPKILPKLENWRDLGKSPISATDNKAIQAPIFQGTLSWARDESGKPVKLDDLEERYKDLTTEEKGKMLLKKRIVTKDQLKRWLASPLDIYEGAVRNRFESNFLKAGVLWKDAELTGIFNLTPEQIGLYKEFHASIGKSLDNMAKAEMLRYGGKDVEPLKTMVMDAKNANEAGILLRDYLLSLAGADLARSDALTESANGMVERADTVNKLKAEGYAPLSRFGKYSVDVVVNGQREYFGLHETMRDANIMSMKMKAEFGSANVSQGTMSESQFKLFAGTTPETLELFGNMLGLDSTGDQAQDKAFQDYLKLTKTNRSAMRRLIHRKGISGFSEDAGRVLASFLYSNARSTSAALNMGTLGEALAAIPKDQGELKDVAIGLAEYIKNPQEEAQAVRGLLFFQYLAGSVASAFVNMTQPFVMTFPWLSQYGGAVQSGKQLARAMKDMATKGTVYETDLAKALKYAEEKGIVAPQEIHQLMAQARGAGTLRPGDGTKLGNAAANANNTVSRLSLAFGQVFGMAEQINRRSTFIAAYRVAKLQNIADPAGFAEKAINETQGIYNKANKMRFARGAVGGTLMTFKTYSIAYMEMLHRMYTQGGLEGKKAVVLALGVLMLMAGTGGLPGEDDLLDLIDAMLQRMGYNVKSKQAKQQFLEETFGKTAADFIDKGISGLPGVPLDVSGRLGMANLIPGTGLLSKKDNYTRDLAELLGPMGDMVKRGFEGVGKVLSGDIGGAALAVSPVFVRNAVKGVDMAVTGQYSDTKGFKIIETTPLEAALKGIGFQPRTVATVQEATFFGQQAKAGYMRRATEIRAVWAKGLAEKDPDQVRSAREDMTDWNEKNPDQKMVANLPAIWKKAREMNKTKEQRLIDSAPKAIRQQLKRDLAA